jgi:hypothetical protein
MNRPSEGDWIMPPVELGNCLAGAARADLEPDLRFDDIEHGSIRPTRSDRTVVLSIIDFQSK